MLLAAAPATARLAAQKRGTPRRAGAGDAERQVADATSDGDDWHLVTVASGVRVSKRRSPGSRFDTVRGDGVLEVSPSRVVSLIESTDEDVIRPLLWQKTCLS